MTEWDSLPSAESIGFGRTKETTPIHARRRDPLTVLTVGASPATPALAAVTAILQDTGAFIHTWAGFAEVDWPLGFCKRVCPSQGQIQRPPYSKQTQLNLKGHGAELTPLVLM